MLIINIFNMTLYDIDGEKLTPSIIDFDRESKLQRLTENNLEELFNLQFVETEFEYKRLRIDTLAFNAETNSFVIIEYKNKLEYSVIDQGFSYLSLLLNNKYYFIKKYNEITGSNLDIEDFDFSNTKIMIIAPSFTKYQLKSTEFSDLPFELWKVKLYENGCVSYDKIINDSATSIKEVVLDKKNIQINLNSLDFSEDDLLRDKSLEINELYYSLKERLLSEFDDLDMEIFKTLSSYKVNDNLICVVRFSSKSLVIWFFTKTLNDWENKTKDLSNLTTGGSSVNYQIDLKSEDDFDYFIDLFKQVYDEKSLL